MPSTTTRGTITAYPSYDPSHPRELRKRQPTAMERAQTRRPAKPSTGGNIADAAFFQVTAPARHLRLKVALHADGDAADDARTVAALDALKDTYLVCRDGAYATAEPAVIAWVRGRIRSGLLGALRERVMSVSCSVCGEPFPNTPDGRREMEDHVVNSHYYKDPAEAHPDYDTSHPVHADDAIMDRDGEVPSIERPQTDGVDVPIGLEVRDKLLADDNVRNARNEPEESLNPEGGKVVEVAHTKRSVEQAIKRDDPPVRKGR